jgi:hypothetical protein
MVWDRSGLEGRQSCKFFDIFGFNLASQNYIFSDASLGTFKQRVAREGDAILV